jgi:hypothetical protein
VEQIIELLTVVFIVKLAKYNTERVIESPGLTDLNKLTRPQQNQSPDSQQICYYHLLNSANIVGPRERATLNYITSELLSSAFALLYPPPYALTP